VLAGRGDLEIKLALSTAFFGWLALAGFDKAFFFQPVEAGVNAPGRIFATGSFFDVVLNGHAVGVWVQANNGKQQVLFKGR